MEPQMIANAPLSVYSRLFGLIGYPLSHSFSKRFFSEKFAAEGLSDCYYELFPIPEIALFPALIERHPNLFGLNVTIPHKQAVIPYLDELDPGAAAVGAVNTIRVRQGRIEGFNTDVYGFESALEEALAAHGRPHRHALILGTGGAAMAVAWVLKKRGIEFRYVSREPKNMDQLTYEDLREGEMHQHTLIINTTPQGMAPAVDTLPDIPYHYAGEGHLFFDLVYNPTQTLFLKKAKAQGALTMNGLSMLYGQAEKAWQIWNEPVR